MPQVLKEEIRERISSAALEVFATQGYVGATMAGIAARAGLGTASLYRYYSSKAELFAAVVTPELAARFEQLLESRLRSLAHLAGRAPARDEGTAMQLLDFWVEHRLAVVILLDRAAGTEYAHYGERFVELLTKGLISQFRAAHPGVRISAPTRFTVERIFEGTRRTLAAILAEHDDEDALREAIATFWAYQLPGLTGLAAWLADRG